MAGAPTKVRTRALDSPSSWPLVDRAGFYACWLAGLLLCALAASIVGFMLYKGLTELRPALLLQSPTGDVDQSKAGGFLDPILGTFLLTSVGIVLAVPLGVAIATWLTEYGKPAPLARAVESGVEILAGTPSIVLAIFGLIVFSNTAFSFLSFTPEGASAYGRSFFVAGIVMSLIALPLVVGAAREALQAVPNHVREASLALGKTRWDTIRRVLLPSIRPGITTGTVLGMGRIIGDTAIVIILLGGTLELEGVGEIPGLSTLKGTGSTLTSYVYVNSPSGEGNAPEKAYAAGFVLLIIVLGLNYLAGRIARGRKEAPLWSR